MSIARIRIPEFFMLFATLTFASCAHRNEFPKSQANLPHAILRGTQYPNAGHVFASHLNGQPTSFWRMSDEFQIQTGPTNCLLAYSDRKETIGYEIAYFVALPGREYIVARKREPGLTSPFRAIRHPETANAWIVSDRRDQAVIYEAGSRGSNKIVAETPREDAVFGVSSAASAIDQYHKKNP
jgi:hypothetical protein